MKNLSRILVAVFVFSIFATNAIAQTPKPFQGTITFDLTFSGPNLTPADKANLPTTSVMSVKDCNSKTEIAMGAATQTTIKNGTAKSEIIVIDAMGSKYYYKKDSTEVRTENSSYTVSTNITSETKVIAGYTCKKAIITVTDEDNNISTDTIFFTNEIGCTDMNFSEQYKDIHGMVLEMSTTQDSLNINMKAKEVKKSKISDNLFLIPSDAQEMSKEDYKKLFGGGGQ